MHIIEESYLQTFSHSLEAEAEYRRRMEDEQYNQSREYGPSCPWNAPGMSVSDFIGLRLVTQPYPHA